MCLLYRDDPTWAYRFCELIIQSFSIDLSFFFSLASIKIHGKKKEFHHFLAHTIKYNVISSPIFFRVFPLTWISPTEKYIKGALSNCKICLHYHYNYDYYYSCYYCFHFEAEKQSSPALSYYCLQCENLTCLCKWWISIKSLIWLCTQVHLE